MIPLIVDCAEVTANEAPNLTHVAVLEQTSELGFADENNTNLWAQPNYLWSHKDMEIPVQPSHGNSVRNAGTGLDFEWAPEDTNKSNYDWVTEDIITPSHDRATENTSKPNHGKPTKQKIKPDKTKNGTTKLTHSKATENISTPNFDRITKDTTAKNQDRATNNTIQPIYSGSSKDTTTTNNDYPTDDTSARKLSAVEPTTEDQWIGAVVSPALWIEGDDQGQWPELGQPAQDDWTQVSYNKKTSKQEQKLEGKVTSAQNSNVNVPCKAKRKKTSAKVRPNYFIAVRCTDPAIGEALENVTSEIISQNPEYDDVCYNRNEIHVTLCTLALTSDKEIRRAVRVLEKMKSELMSRVPTEPLKIAGISEFSRGVVIYGNVHCPKQFLDFRAFLLGRLEEAGVHPTDDDDYVSHMTIGKINERFIRRVPDVINFPEVVYKKVVNTTFGFQKVHGIHLCKMGSQRREDGFYTCPTEVMF